MISISRVLWWWINNSGTTPYGFSWKCTWDLFNVRHMWSIRAIWVCLWALWGGRTVSYLPSLTEHLEENLEQSSSSVSIYCTGDWGQGDINPCMEERTLKQLGSLLHIWCITRVKAESHGCWSLTCFHLLFTSHPNTIPPFQSQYWLGHYATFSSLLYILNQKGIF